MSHEAGNWRGQGKTEISLKRDQWSRVEKRLIELRRGAEKRIKVWGGVIEEAEGGTRLCSFFG